MAGVVLMHLRHLRFCDRPDRVAVRGGNRGSRYSDGSAVDGNGNGFQVQTVDTRADVSLTSREANAARDIAERSGQPVACVAKERCN